MKFRKKPIVIEAHQWFPGVDYCEGVCDCPEGSEANYQATGETHCVPHIHTLEGTMIVSPGDWIIAGVKGERYPCKPDIFDATYERAE